MKWTTVSEETCTCGFTGEVEITIERHMVLQSTYSWACPACEFEHEDVWE